MQINPRYSANGSVNASAKRPDDCLKQVILGTKVSEIERANLTILTDRSPAMAEVDQLLRDVACYLGQG